MFQTILRMILGQTNIYNRIIQFEEKNIRLFIKSKHTFNNLKTTRISESTWAPLIYFYEVFCGCFYS